MRNNIFFPISFDVKPEHYPVVGGVLLATLEVRFDRDKWFSLINDKMIIRKFLERRPSMLMSRLPWLRLISSWRTFLSGRRRS